ncbi:chloride channel protein, partial [Streptomyces sp. BRA346]|uniref:chloride channel protein n=1 Tax=Streptomyces sp. BRA346 TaxID=2878199 RepID=UPI004063874E
MSKSNRPSWTLLGLRASVVELATQGVDGPTLVLVACGAAGGIAATFNAPLAGVFFAMELILRDF